MKQKKHLHRALAGIALLGLLALGLAFGWKQSTPAAALTSTEEIQPDLFLAAQP